MNLQLKQLQTQLPTAMASQLLRSRFATMNTPSMGDSISEGTIQQWNKNVGDRVEIGDILAIVETDKISAEVVAEMAGTITKIHVPCDEICSVGEPLVEIGEGSADTGEASTSGAIEDIAVPTLGDSVTEGVVQEVLVKVGDTVKEGDEIVMVETDKISVPLVTPKGGVVMSVAEEGQEITVGETYLQLGPVGSSASAPEVPKAAPAAATGIEDAFGRTIQLKPLSRMRLTVAARLKHAQNTAASLTTFNEVDMSHLKLARKNHGEAFLAKNGVKLGFMSFFLKACSKALEEFPDINSHIGDDGKMIEIPSFTDISVAVASPTGLVVPVLRDCQNHNLSGFEKELGALAGKARDGKITMQDMAGGNFTISNGGVFGSLMGTPILNPPQSAILGMHGTFDRPVAVDGKIEIRPMMYIALTYDHRIVDGREAVLFLKRVKELVEQPEALLGLLEEC